MTNAIENQADRLISYEQWLAFNQNTILLQCLLAHGVDTWEGYSDAMEMYRTVKHAWSHIPESSP